MTGKRNIIICLIFFFLAAKCHSDMGMNIDFEAGEASSGYNYVRIPGNTGTKFSLKDDLKVKNSLYFRLRITKEIKNGKYISFLYAPLSLYASGILPGTINYNGDTFAQGSDIDARYRFDSYRLTYYKVYKKSRRFSYKLGFTAKIRDAAVRVDDGATVSEKKNTGFVPLLNMGMTYSFNYRYSLVLNTDALAGGPGRAEDVMAALNVRSNEYYSVRVGYRFVEGGADTDEVYTFAMINYLFAAISISF